MDMMIFLIFLWMVLGVLNFVLELYIKRKYFESFSLFYITVSVLFGPIGFISTLIELIPTTNIKNPFYKGK